MTKVLITPKSYYEIRHRMRSRLGGLEVVFNETGRTLTELPRLNTPPAYDGLIAAGAYLYLSTTDGRLHCFGE